MKTKKRSRQKLILKYRSIYFLGSVLIILAIFILFIMSTKKTENDHTLVTKNTTPIQESVTQLQSPTPTQTISWKIYKDNPGGYLVSIPSNWSAHPVKDNGTSSHSVSYNCFGDIYDSSPPYGSPCIQITETDQSLSSVISSCEQNFTNRNQTIFNENSIQLDGVSAEEFIVNSGVSVNPILKLDVIVLVRNAKLYNIQSGVTDSIPYKTIFNSFQFQ